MLSADRLDPARLFAGCASFSSLLLAVSGGPDSLALLRLAALWRAQGAPVHIHVATVDHGLRPEAAAEAEQVGRWSAALGLPHRILRWQGDKPRADLQQKAREARYRLLFAHAREIGAQAVAVAHHADDQAETLLMRLARGSGPAGLAAMAPAQKFGENLLLRPLLGLRKQQLIDFCRAEGQEFFEDPSNGDPRFERARWRAAAPELTRLGLTAEICGRLAERMAKNEAALDFAAQNLFSSLKKPETGVYDFSRLDEAPIALVERCLALAFRELAGAAPARLERLERCAALLRAARQQGRAAATTLHGHVARLDRAGVLRLSPEPPRRRGGGNGGAQDGDAQDGGAQESDV